MADYAINQCQWIEVDKTDDSTDNNNSIKHHKSSARSVRGWHYLDDNETCCCPTRSCTAVRCCGC